MRTSPFIKSESDKSIHFLTKRAKQAGEQVHSLFPNSGDVPHSIRLYTACFYVGVVCAAFIYLMYTGYKATQRDQFLAPYFKGHADTRCGLIPVSYTGDFQATLTGVWEGASDFSYSDAVYTLSVTAYAVTSETFKENMDVIYDTLKTFGQIGSKLVLDDNLLLWMSLVIVNNTSNAQRFNMIGDPLIIFDRDYTEGVVSSVKGNCNVSSQAAFDKATGFMSLTWNYVEFIAEPKCVEAMDPELFGYNTLTKPEDFTIFYDIRTLITGNAVNRKLVQLQQLVEITKYRSELNYNGTVLSMRKYFDPKYAGMDPLLCAIVEGFDPFCTPEIGDVIMFPIFHHVGVNLTSPEECDCAVQTAEELMDPTHNCNMFRFLSGFIYVNNAFDAAYMFALRVTKLGTYEAVQAGAHRPMFIASSYGQNSLLKEQLNSPESLEAAYDFCTVGAQTCSVITFSTYDIKPNSWAVSEYYTLVQNGACRDTISPTVEDWDTLVTTPYGPLVQNYQQCRYDTYDTLLNSTGIAMGNIQIVAPLCVAFLMIITYLHKWWNKVPLDESYSKQEKDSALDAFSMSLLLSRDGKSKTHSFHNNHSIIELIAEELGEHTMLSDMSHKTHHSAYSMNLSNHSLSGADSPTRRMYNRLAELNSGGRTRSRGNSTVVPIVVESHPLALEMPSYTDPSPGSSTNTGYNTLSTKKYMTYEDEQESRRQELEFQLALAESERTHDQMQMIDLEKGSDKESGKM